MVPEGLCTGPGLHVPAPAPGADCTPSRNTPHWSKTWPEGERGS